jgi:Kef-type K+ transport system membrane component KefB
MDNVWLASALWLGLALIASVLSVWVAISAALTEIVVGAVAGNIVGLPLAPWVNFLAGFGAILLTFLAGAEIDPQVVRKHLWSSMSIGVVGFLAPYVGVLLFARYVVDWPWPQAQIAGISLSTTSVAVVYAVMVETGFNRTELGKIILAACFVNDLGTVLALGLVFARYDVWLALFAGATVGALWLPGKFAPRLLEALGDRVSEPQTKFVALVLLFLGGLASVAGSEAVLPASGGHGSGAHLPEGSRASEPHAYRGLHHPDAILFPESRITRRGPRCRRFRWPYPDLSRHQDGDQVRWNPAAHARLQV